MKEDKSDSEEQKMVDELRETNGSRATITTIFNPKKCKTPGTRTPSIVVTDENASNNTSPSEQNQPLVHNKIVKPQAQVKPHPKNQSPLLQRLINGPSSNQCNNTTSTTTFDESTRTEDTRLQRLQDSTPTSIESTDGTKKRLLRCKKALLSQKTRKLVCGVIVTACVAGSWVGATQAIKQAYLLKIPVLPSTTDLSTVASDTTTDTTDTTTFITSTLTSTKNATNKPIQMEQMYDAPFLTTWLSTLWTILFYPLYFLIRLIFRTEKTSAGTIIRDSVHGLREKGFTMGQFFWRCVFFCLLWVLTNYLYVNSLRILQCTAVMALFATNISIVYLLSWVILHEQFVGIRIVAAIMSNTGIALLAYMDGISKGKTLGGVVLAVAAATGSSVYKVLFKKILGESTFGQVALVFSILGLLAAVLLWPICLLLSISGLELIRWNKLPWLQLLLAGGLSFLANLLGNFGIAITYEIFITLGLILAVPVCAVLDSWWYQVTFEGMFLAGIIMVAIGFFLVLFPENWPDYITRVLRWTRGRNQQEEQTKETEKKVDYRTGHIRSHLRSPSGRVR